MQISKGRARAHIISTRQRAVHGRRPPFRPCGLPIGEADRLNAGHNDVVRRPNLEEGQCFAQALGGQLSAELVSAMSLGWFWKA